MYGAYLFFRYASLNAISYQFVRGFYELGEGFKEPLLAVNAALGAALWGDFATVWPTFVLALWNQDPVPAMTQPKA